MVNQDETKQFSDRQLSFSYWWFGHKGLLRKLILVIILAINLGLYINIGVYFINYFSEGDISSWPSQLASKSIDWPKVHDLFSPKSVIVGETKVIPISPGIYDVMIWLENPNSKWYGHEVEYKIIFAGQKSDSQTTFLLPGEEKIIFGQNFRSTDPNALNETARVVFSDIEWQFVKEADTYLLPSFEVSDIVLDRLDDQVTKTRITANVKNRGLSGFHSAKVTAIIWSGENPVAINSTNLQEFTIQETRPVDVRFVQNIPYYTDIDIVVSADNQDSENIISS